MTIHTVFPEKFSHILRHLHEKENVINRVKNTENVSSDVKVKLNSRAGVTSPYLVVCASEGRKAKRLRVNMLEGGGGYTMTWLPWSRGFIADILKRGIAYLQSWRAVDVNILTRAPINMR